MYIRILRQIQPHPPNRDLLPARPTIVVLNDLELDEALLQHVRLIHRQAHHERALIVPRHFVFFDRRLGRRAPVLRGRGHGEVPFYVGLSRDEGHVVEVDYLAAKGSVYGIPTAGDGGANSLPVV